ncbi:MAG: DUF406 family protein [Ferrimonas sp.]
MSLKHEQTAADCCGAYADIGSVISAEDNILDVDFEAASEAVAVAQFDEALARAQARFEGVTGTAQWHPELQRMQGQIRFNYAAERLIFELG